ncbi:hypothetical protein PHLGIDRAFT_234508 [Phlebiopsis gigantea 11061_1 CR5-6]|uniref:Uncharacterized protein n=1 Tax=Phlebiopsis gigantea (strain 11061_1 CR5-6) TaxID=745531 RepID=A0A0C3RSV2_PHLG1|nr:hypothetical protein PHLGIDRAFT_234508 [Phlebiopsis gigantea 11061_1 CR5-6]
MNGSGDNKHDFSGKQWYYSSAWTSAWGRAQVLELQVPRPRLRTPCARCRSSTRVQGLDIHPPAPGSPSHVCFLRPAHGSPGAVRPRVPCGRPRAQRRMRSDVERARRPAAAAAQCGARGRTLERFLRKTPPSARLQMLGFPTSVSRPAEEGTPADAHAEMRVRHRVACAVVRLHMPRSEVRDRRARRAVGQDQVILHVAQQARMGRRPSWCTPRAVPRSASHTAKYGETASFVLYAGRWKMLVIHAGCGKNTRARSYMPSWGYTVVEQETRRCGVKKKYSTVRYANRCANVHQRT